MPTRLPPAHRILAGPAVEPVARMKRWCLWLCDALWGAGDREAVSQLGLALRAPATVVASTRRVRRGVRRVQRYA